MASIVVGLQLYDMHVLYRTIHAIISINSIRQTMVRYREEPDCYLHYGRHDWAPAKISIRSVAKNQINVYK